MTTAKTKRQDPTGFRLTDADKEKLARLAKEAGVSKSNVIRTLIQTTKSVKVKISQEE